MKKAAGMLIVLFFVAAALGQPAWAADLVKFNGGIGVIPTGSANNTVRGVSPPGQIWVISALVAAVKDDGRIKVDGRGLLLGGGNNIGGNANQSVFATLFCANDGNVEHSSTATGVPLAPNGDFTIDDVLSGDLPSTCENPVLLIRNVAGAWFAAGIPVR